MLKYTCPEMDNDRSFFQLDTGQGKTALCYLIALRFVQVKGKSVFIVNKSDDLTFRDFKKAYSLSQAQDVRVTMVKDSAVLDKMKVGIHFMNSKLFLEKIILMDREAISRCSFIFDEFDNLIFEDYPHAALYATVFKSLNHFIALSGSKFQKYHKEFIERHCKATFVDFSMTGNDRVEPQCIRMCVESKVNEWKTHILLSCLELRDKCPTIIVCQ
jgi:hypothetical protein